MAGHARYTAVLDACVLYPMALSDALMSLASKGLFAGKWTTRIEDEWIRNLEEQRPDLLGRLTTRRDAMREAVLDWEVQEAAWQALAPSLALPDPDDVHVLAAAIAGHADCIVTANLKDFPIDRVGPFGIEVIHPDDFIVKQLDLDPFAALASQIIREIREELAKLSNKDLEDVSWLRIDYAEPGPDCEGVRLQLRTRLAEEMLDERSGISKADRKALTPSLCRAVSPK